MEQNPPEEERFLTNVLDLTALVHELATTCWNSGTKDINPQLVFIAEKYLENYDKISLIETFIKHSHPHWDEIKNRNEEFFIEHAHILFKHLPIDSNNINAFKVFFTAIDENGENIIIEEDRDAIWDIFDSLVKICIKYVHKVRGVKLVDTGKGLRPAYIKNKFPDIKVRKQAKIWGIKLQIPGE